MSQQLISRNPDLLRLQEDGYEVSIEANHLVLRNIPYVTPAKAVARGILVSTLTLAGESTQRPDTHTVMFAGEAPCDANGQRLDKVINGTSPQTLGPGLTVDFTFSSKPACGYYDDYFQKMTTYASILASQAAVIDAGATPRTRRVVENNEEASSFVYLDTASSRAGINNLSRKLEDEKVAIVGVGGTGSYILDLIAKTGAARIDLFDDDDFLQHNAFRAPGAASLDSLRNRPKKVDYLANIYSNMHRHIEPHAVRLGPDNFHLLDGTTFVFLCMDSGSTKKALVADLERRNLPFIDVGMGLHLIDDALIGQVRVTTSTPELRPIEGRIPLEGTGLDNEYARNIQIADLNMLNAAFAVIRWKKYRGFYKDLEREHFSVYAIDGNHLLNEDKLEEDEACPALPN